MEKNIRNYQAKIGSFTEESYIIIYIDKEKKFVISFGIGDKINRHV